MKKQSRKSKKLSALRRKAGYVVGASLLAAGVSAPAADAVKPEQMYEGGTNAYANWIELSAGGMISDGNTAQAQQRTRLNSGAFGGIEDLHYQTEIAKKTTLKLDGRGIYDDHDYKIGLGVEREGLGFIHFNFENFRTWDSGNGGFSPVNGVAYPNSGDALALDRGQISLEAGYNKAGQPKVTFKYTHRYRDGEKGTTIWGPIHDPKLSVFRLFPGIYDIDEKSDAFQLDVAHHIKKVDVGLGVRFETGEINNAYKRTSWAGESVQQKDTDRQGTSYDMLSVHAFAESWIKPNQFLSAGFMFANLDDTFTGSRIYGDDFDVIYTPGLFPLGYYDLNGGSHKNEYVANLNWMWLPTKNFTITPSLRVQKEDWNANSTGTGTLDNFSPKAFNSNSSRDSLDVRGRLDARYTGVTNWVFSASGEWTEGQGNLNINGGLSQINHIGPDTVTNCMDDSRFFQKYAVSARWYPVKQASVDVGGYYKINQYDYANTQDSTPNDLSTGNAYPGFLVYQGFQTWDGNARLTLHPLSKITLVSRYEYQFSTIATRPDAASGLGEVDSSQMHSHILGQNLSWTPLNWLCLQAGANYVISETKTPASDYTQAILNSQNNYWTVNFNAGFVLDDKTDLNVGYFYYRAADGQNAVVNGLPLGTDAEEHSINATLTRRLTKNLRLNLKYAFTHYEDFASAGNYNFNAHVIFSSLQYRF
jgi:hypothetical protein